MTTINIINHFVPNRASNKYKITILLFWGNVYYTISYYYSFSFYFSQMAMPLLSTCDQG